MEGEGVSYEITQKHMHYRPATDHLLGTVSTAVVGLASLSFFDAVVTAQSPGDYIPAAIYGTIGFVHAVWGLKSGAALGEHYGSRLERILHPSKKARDDIPSDSI